jgi:hypothetical protein
VVQQQRHRLHDGCELLRHSAEVCRRVHLAPFVQVLLQEGGAAGERIGADGLEPLVDVDLDLRAAGVA